MACEKWVDRYELWKEWQKNCRNPWLHKILVLLGLAKSPTFEYYRRFRLGDTDNEEFDALLREILREYKED